MHARLFKSEFYFQIVGLEQEQVLVLRGPYNKFETWTSERVALCQWLRDSGIPKIALRPDFTLKSVCNALLQHQQVHELDDIGLEFLRVVQFGLRDDLFLELLARHFLGIKNVFDLETRSWDENLQIEILTLLRIYQVLLLRGGEYHWRLRYAQVQPK